MHNAELVTPAIWNVGANTSLEDAENVHCTDMKGHSCTIMSLSDIREARGWCWHLSAIYWVFVFSHHPWSLAVKGWRGIVITLPSGRAGRMYGQVCECNNAQMRGSRSFKLIPFVFLLRCQMSLNLSDLNIRVRVSFLYVNKVTQDFELDTTGVLPGRRRGSTFSCQYFLNREQMCCV